MRRWFPTEGGKALAKPAIYFFLLTTTMASRLDCGIESKDDENCGVESEYCSALSDNNVNCGIA